ncbi:hypothetical protein LO763_06725 [Glycomyces sp. A-F 0318]|uniref:hypothetical protein n=1 Tax=Glycomyces amatae TaxID=2881355 RepID=UPI001E48454E|nr:hypothetical protein [Glycomyces amatae]MCD0443319.1 hypothetical protein [Glycomyces amatae]
MPQLHQKSFKPLASLALAGTACSSPPFLDETEAYEFVTGAAEATLTFTPAGNVENLDGGDSVFADTPEPTERALVF